MVATTLAITTRGGRFTEGRSGAGATSMTVPVVKVGIVLMCVPQRGVRVRVRMRLTAPSARTVLVCVMLVVSVQVLVFERLVGVLVLVAFADVDGDGDLDLLVNGVAHGTRLFLNDGKAKFRETTDEAGLRSTSGSTSLTLAGAEGVVIEMEDVCRLVVSISVLQCSAAAEIDRGWVQPVG